MTMKKNKKKEVEFVSMETQKFNHKNKKILQLKQFSQFVK
jgi:hypothetical protein